MTTIPMPEPVAHLRNNGFRFDAAIEPTGGDEVDLITTTQAEAYANARARAALEEAATIIEKNALDCIPTTAVILLSQAQAIRALIQKEAKS